MVQLGHIKTKKLVPQNQIHFGYVNCMVSMTAYSAILKNETVPTKYTSHISQPQLPTALTLVLN